ncbi:hypothetical protein BDY17DRAFT_324000 [Neohortaea acidophila]|uniref:Uncharacterized protein n=1 Tax=Neohortaea acidophila TaxID=245834 RepID=A0A6A6PVF3_9PEZI|nr:uncharacterized protein BDY17DRAFT_324000 [Neohortaea acidophila]KAF2483247.1 hypothetical protein BDY17DRAFT_324000 [Neohortaea acidophila]
MQQWAALRPRLLNFATRYRQHSSHRLSSTKQAAPPPQSRIERIESRLPRFLRRIVTPLRNAPLSHVTAFLILHEITAVVPLLGLTAAFHYGNYLPPFISEWKWAKEGAEKYGNYMRRKGWIQEDSRTGRWWGRGEGGIQIVVEIATAYAITKALLPFRLIVSVWGTPWFARWTVLPLTSRLWRRFGKGKGVAVVTSSPAAGTNAVGGRVLPSSIK